MKRCQDRQSVSDTFVSYMGNLNRSTILRQVQETLDTAEHGLRMILSNDPRQRLVGLRNLVVFGRAVTNVLQQLRSVTPEFEPWYQTWVDRMRGDSIMSYFYKIRSEILKEGRLRTGAFGYIKSLNTQALFNIVPKPPGAKNFFIGDQSGGIGWLIELPNGDIQKFYVEIPHGIPGIEISANFFFSEAPDDIKGIPVPKLAQYYFTYLKNLFNEAKEKFKE